MNQDLGKILKDARKKLGLSQSEVALKINTYNTKISHIENDSNYRLWKDINLLKNLIDLYGLEENFIYNILNLSKKKEIANNKYDEHIFRLGELFCGPGGLAFGALHASDENGLYSIKHAWANDIDEDTCTTYRSNICPESPETVICKNVKELDITSLSDIDAFAFGFPCNDYSLVGEHKGIDGEYGPLYTYGVKVLQEKKPRWFIAENVGGIRSANNGTAFKNIMKELQNCGYKTYPNLYKFEEYGLPQARHRVIIVGIRNDENVEFKIPSTKPYETKDNSCRHAIENPPIADDASNNIRTRQSATVIKRLSYIKPGENAFNADIPDEYKLHVKGATLSHIYKRLVPDKPAYTLTAAGGGGTHVYHWSENRALTNRERARLQTFPDNYVFYGNNESVRKQIGMAVPCEGAKIIISAILNTFAGIEYESMEASII